MGDQHGRGGDQDGRSGDDDRPNCEEEPEKERVSPTRANASKFCVHI